MRKGLRFMGVLLAAALLLGALAGCSNQETASSDAGTSASGGGSEAKPVGTVWFGLATKDGAETFRRRFDGDRAAVRRQTVEEVLRRLAEVGARL